MKKIAICLTSLAILTSVSSCKKNDSNTTTAPTASTPQVNLPADSWGFFTAVKTITEQTIPVVGGTQRIEVGTAVAGLNSGAGSSSWVDAGTIKVDDSTLTKQSNNSYLYSVGANNYTGLSFNYTTYWSVSGNGSVSGINYYHNAYMPSIGTLNSSTDINTSNAYTASVSSVSSADSVIFVLSGPNKSIQKVKPFNSNSCEFTASEVGSLGKGDNMGLLQIAAYNWTVNTVGGKKYYYIKETVLSKFVNLK